MTAASPPAVASFVLGLDCTYSTGVQVLASQRCFGMKVSWYAVEQMRIVLLRGGWRGAYSIVKGTAVIGTVRMTDKAQICGN